jgi:hypothetical protein
MRVLPMFVLMALLSGSAVLHGQTRDEQLEAVRGADPDQAMEACSAVIHSGQDTGIKLARSFTTEAWHTLIEAITTLPLSTRTKLSASMQVLLAHMMPEAWRTRTTVITTMSLRISIKRCG